MVRKVIKICLVLIFGFICFLAGYLIHPKPTVYLILTNQSNYNIRNARITHEKGICLIENIIKGQSKQIEFPVKGESSYTLSVEFDNGKKIDGAGGYVESGYKIEEIITDSRVQSNIILPRW